MDLHKSDKRSNPIVHSRLETEASHLVNIVSQPPKNASPLCEIEVKSREQPHVSLGNYTASSPLKGFTLRITPNPESESIITQITQLGNDEEYEIVLHIANYGDRPVTVEVYQINTEA